MVVTEPHSTTKQQQAPQWPTEASVRGQDGPTVDGAANSLGAAFDGQVVDPDMAQELQPMPVQWVVEEDGFRCFKFIPSREERAQLDAMEAAAIAHEAAMAAAWVEGDRRRAAICLPPVTSRRGRPPGSPQTEAERLAQLERRREWTRQRDRARWRWVRDSETPEARQAGLHAQHERDRARLVRRTAHRAPHGSERRRSPSVRPCPYPPRSARPTRQPGWNAGRPRPGRTTMRFDPAGRSSWRR